MGGNPFKKIGRAIGGVVGGILGIKPAAPRQEPMPQAPPPVDEVEIDTTKNVSDKIARNRRRSSFAGTFLASKAAVSQGQASQGKSFLGQ